MLENYEKMSTTQKNTFTDVANKLLANTFLSRDKKDNKESYYFIVSFKEIFDEFFAILDYEVVLDTNLGAVMLSGGGTSNLKLKKEETILLLIIRILYHEKLKDTSINENIIATLDDIHEKYNYLELKKRINKTDLIASLRLFKRLNIIEIIGDLKTNNARVVILPTVLYAIHTENINEVFLTVSKITSDEAGE